MRLVAYEDSVITLLPQTRCFSVRIFVAYMSYAQRNTSKMYLEWPGVTVIDDILNQYLDTWPWRSTNRKNTRSSWKAPKIQNIHSIGLVHAICQSVKSTVACNRNTHDAIIHTYSWVKLGLRGQDFSKVHPVSAVNIHNRTTTVFVKTAVLNQWTGTLR